MDPLDSLSFSLNISRNENLVRTMTAQLRSAIVEGKMEYGQRMPSTRELASALAVSRNTVISVYEQLMAESLIVSQRGNGSFVSFKSQTISDERINEKQSLVNKLLPEYRNKSVEDILPKKTAARYNFAVGHPEVQYFPFFTLEACTQ